MSQHIAVACAPPKPRDRQAPLTTRDCIRRELGALWVAQTLRNMMIIGLTSAETVEVIDDVLDRWCARSHMVGEPTVRQ